MGRSEREKGKAGEREAADIFIAHGWDDPPAKRSGDAGQPDGDLDHVDPFWAEVRRRERLELQAWIAEVTEKCPPGRIPLIVFRASRMPWRVDLDLEDFLGLVAQIPGLTERAQNPTR